MSLIAELDPTIITYLTRGRLAGSNLKLQTQYLEAENEITVYQDVKMTLGKAIELNLTKDTDHRHLSDADMITVKLPKKVKFTNGQRHKFTKAVKAVGWNAGNYHDEAGEDEADTDNKAEASKARILSLERQVNFKPNNAKMTDRPYELAFAANNSKSLLESLDIGEASSKKSLSLWRYINDNLPFELTSYQVPKLLAIVALRLTDKSANSRASQHQQLKQTVDVSLSNGRIVSYVHHTSKANKGEPLSNPLSGMTVLGAVGKDKLLVTYNDDKKKKKHVIDKPSHDSAVMPPSVEVKHVFLVIDQCGDEFYCDYVSGGDYYKVKLTIPFALQRLAITRNFVMWLPDTINILNK